MNQVSIPYSEIKSDLKTGDIVLFHGNTLIEDVIQISERTDWSHVGMIVLPQDVGICGRDDILLWESSPIEYYDYETKTCKAGPHLISLTKLLSCLTQLSKKRYFSIRYLEADRNEKLLCDLQSFISSKTVLSSTFPSDTELIAAFLKGHFEHKKSEKGTYFCSELIADTYKNIGLLTAKYPVNSYSPKSFSSLGKIALLKRAWLRNEILLDYNG